MSRIRFSAGLICLALVALAGCGGGGGSKTAAVTAPTAPSAPSATVPQTESSSMGTSEPEIQTTTGPTQTSTSPEEQPGGAGDEHPIATQALFTGKNGKVTPARIRVPPFIAVRVVLQTKDGQGYTLLVNGKEVAVGEGRQRASVRLDGLRPGKKYILQNEFGRTPKTLTIVANAEPGP